MSRTIEDRIADTCAIRLLRRVQNAARLTPTPAMSDEAQAVADVLESRRHEEDRPTMAQLDYEHAADPDLLCACDDGTGAHTFAAHTLIDGVYACAIPDCACGPGCIHEGFVPQDGSAAPPVTVDRTHAAGLYLEEVGEDGEAPAPSIAPADFPRAPRDEAEREACANNTDRCVAFGPEPHRRPCRRPHGHEGDHVAASAFRVFARWPQESAPAAPPFDAHEAFAEIRSIADGALDEGDVCEDCARLVEDLRGLADAAMQRTAKDAPAAPGDEPDGEATPGTAPAAGMCLQPAPDGKWLCAREKGHRPGGGCIYLVDAATGDEAGDLHALLVEARNYFDMECRRSEGDGKTCEEAIKTDHEMRIADLCPPCVGMRLVRIVEKRAALGKGDEAVKAARLDEARTATDEAFEEAYRSLGDSSHAERVIGLLESCVREERAVLAGGGGGNDD